MKLFSPHRPCLEGGRNSAGRTRVRRHTSTHHMSLNGTSSPRPLPRLQARAPWSTIRLARASAFTFCCGVHAVRSLVSQASTKFRCCGVMGRQAYFSCSVCQSVATAALNSDSHGPHFDLSSASSVLCAEFCKLAVVAIIESNSRCRRLLGVWSARARAPAEQIGSIGRVFAKSTKWLPASLRPLPTTDDLYATCPVVPCGSSTSKRTLGQALS